MTDDPKIVSQIPTNPPKETLPEALISRGVRILDEYATALLFGMFISGYIIFYVLKIPDKIDKCSDMINDIQDKIDRLIDYLKK